MFITQAKIVGPSKKTITQKLLVDTGASYTCLPYHLATELDLPLLFETKVVLADGTQVNAWHSAAYMEINGRADATQVRIFDVAEPAIGVFTLEALGLAVDPITGELKRSRSFIARA